MTNDDDGGNQGWGAGAVASRSRVPLGKKPRRRSRGCLEKNPGAGAAKKLASTSALREDKKHKEIVL